VVGGLVLLGKLARRSTGRCGRILAHAGTSVRGERRNPGRGGFGGAGS
jgi:hypothetical protein